MNKIYKIVWSTVKQCYVVASELAKNRTKAPKSKIFSQALIAGILSCVLNIGFAGHVFAETQTYISYPYSDYNQQFNPGEFNYSIEGPIYSITLTDGKLTGISFLTGYTVGGDSDNLYLAHSQTYSLGSSDGVITYTAGNGITISSDNKVYV